MSEQDTTVDAQEEYLQSILCSGAQVPVLDKGFVRFIDKMGTDEAIVQAARTSYGKGTKTKSEDQGLINYLMRHKHTTPFEMCELKFHVKLPIFVARQWIRHRTWSFNEYSCRYSEVPDDVYMPEPSRVQSQSTANKQGSGEQVVGKAAEGFLNVTTNVQAIAAQAIAFGEKHEVARELNRINMTVAHYTEWYCKVDLHNLFHFLELRLDPHAQMEIRAYATVIASMVAQLFPMSWSAFVHHRLEACRLSLVEQFVIADMLKEKLDMHESRHVDLLSKTEVLELKKKIDKMLALEVDAHA